jgi:hypothetical protein
MITRRLALFRIASASAVAATAATAAIQPKNAEDPALLYLGRKVAKLDAICQHRKMVKGSARAAYEKVAPALPVPLIVLGTAMILPAASAKLIATATTSGRAIQIRGRGDTILATTSGADLRNWLTLTRTS